MFHNISRPSLLLVLTLSIALSACTSGDSTPGTPDASAGSELELDGSQPGSNDSDAQEGQTPTEAAPSSSGDFKLRSVTPDLVLVEGNQSGITFPITLSRQNGHRSPVELSLGGQSIEDSAFVTGSFSELTLTPDADSSEVTLTLAIADAPIMPQTRNFVITATDGSSTDRTLVQVQVEPVDAPDVYLLAGQSNMVGFSGDGTRESFAGGADASDARILQLNVSKNDRESIFRRASDFASRQKNVVAPDIVIAQDPLHVPIDGDSTVKELEYIGLGLSFAKAALPNTSREIVLVPTAWSGSAFCADDEGPNGQWNPSSTSNPELGNTLLFDRAVARTNIALEDTGGILRGILWHQGESDSNDRCGNAYADNIVSLVRAFRTEIDADLRGPSMRGPDANIPFVLGTMSRGIDARGDLSEFTESKQLVDDAHRALPGTVPNSALSNHDDLVPANGYPCGNSTCVHFGAEALREMGGRYYEALREASR